MKAYHQEKEFEFQRHILLSFWRSQVKSLNRSLRNSKDSMGLALRILSHAGLWSLRDCLQSSVEMLGLYATFLLGLKLKRGRIVSCFPESRVPFIFPPNVPRNRRGLPRPSSRGC